MREKNRKPIASYIKLPQFTTMNVIDGQAGLIIYASLIFYSLTIDNILNIIVLLILAGVTIATLTGDNGLLSKASIAKNTSTEAEVIEKIKLAYQDYYLGQHTEAGYTFQNAVDKMFGEGVATVTEANGVYTVTVNGKTYEYNVLNGSITEAMNWETILANAKKHPDQPEEITDIGIDIYGNSVNLGKWIYELNETDKTIKTGNHSVYPPQPGYNGNIVDGKIEGEIPQFIIRNGDKYTLTSLKIAFSGKTQLTQAPIIPNTVTDMTSTFFNTSIAQAPRIPDSVINMQGTFGNCTLLTQITTIPNSVTNLNYTFQNCTLLEQLPTIPSSVTDMISAFAGCRSLTGNLVINASNVTNYSYCFYNTATNEGSSLVVSGSCPQLDDIIATKGSNSHITK